MLQLRNAEFCRWRRHRINFCTSHVTGKEAIPCGWWMLSDRGLTQCTSKYFLCIRTFVSCTITARRYISAANHDFACTPRSMPYIFCNFSLTSLTQPHRAYYYQVRKAKRSLAKMQGELHCRFHYRVQWRVMQSNVLVAIEAQLHYMLLCDPAIVIRPVFFSFFFFSPRTTYRALVGRIISTDSYYRQACDHFYRAAAYYGWSASHRAHSTSFRGEQWKRLSAVRIDDE
jgi:hypothetical protein